MVPCQNSDFDSKSLGDYYFSAPTSPNCHHLPPFYKDFDELSIPAAVPFAWEEKPGLPKSADDFVFDVSQDWETASLSAEDLFDGGVIKPMITPPPAEIISESLTSPPCQTRKVIQKVGTAKQVVARPRRGRDRDVSKSRAARSLSPLRDRDKYPWEKEEEKDHPDNGESINSAESTKEQKKWTLMDFFLFRSASEGRAADRDPLKKYTAAALRRSSFRAIESPGSRKRGHISAHELHYTVNRAVSEDLKRKTFLPYKQGILGRLAFNPAVHALANGFGFSRKRSDTNNTPSSQIYRLV